jgi:hypothetical protein
MQAGQNNRTRELLATVQRHFPKGHCLVQEAFTTEHRRPVLIKLAGLRADTFYLFDEITARAFTDAVAELAERDGEGRLVLSYPAAGEFQSRKPQLQRLAVKLNGMTVLAHRAPQGSAQPLDGIECRTIDGTGLSRYRIALADSARPVLFIGREAQVARTGDGPRYMGFFSFDRVTIDQIADEVQAVARGRASRLHTFEKLELLHQTTQRVARELDSYSRRMELAIRRVQRRPDLLTPARFERIVGQAILKMEELKEIPRRALRSMRKPMR